MKGALFHPTRVVFRIDVIELQGSLSVDLHDRFSLSHGVVVHVGSRKAKLPATKVFILLASNSSPIPTLNVPEMMVTFSRLRVPMGRDAEPIRHLQANGVVAAGSGWVALEHRKLRAWTHNRRRRTPGNGLRGEYVLFVQDAPRVASGESRPATTKNPATASARNKYRFMIATSIEH